MEMFKGNMGWDDFTHSKMSLDWIVLEERRMCLAQPVAFNSDWHILSSCFAVVCVCVSVCVYLCVAACLLQLPEIESRANCEQR